MTCRDLIANRPLRLALLASTILAVLLTLLSTVLPAQSGKTFIGQVTEATAKRITAVENGASKQFMLTASTKQIPRPAQIGDSVRITFLDADVAVASQVEVIPPSK